MTDFNDTLRAALEPFAKEAATWWDKLPDDARPWIAEPGNTGGDDAQFTVGDLRRLDQIYKALATPAQPLDAAGVREALSNLTRFSQVYLSMGGHDDGDEEFVRWSDILAILPLPEAPASVEPVGLREENARLREALNAEDDYWTSSRALASALPRLRGNAQDVFDRASRRRDAARHALAALPPVKQSAGEAVDACPVCGAALRNECGVKRHPAVEPEDKCVLSGTVLYPWAPSGWNGNAYAPVQVDRWRIHDIHEVKNTREIAPIDDETFRFAQQIVGLANSLQGRDPLDSELVSVKLIRAVAGVVNGQAFLRMELPPRHGAEPVAWFASWEEDGKHKGLTFPSEADAHAHLTAIDAVNGRVTPWFGAAAEGDRSAESAP